MDNKPPDPTQPANIVCLDCGNPYPIGQKYCPVCGAWPPISAVVIARKAMKAGIEHNGSAADGQGLEKHNLETDDKLEDRMRPDQEPTIMVKHLPPVPSLDEAPTVMVRRDASHPSRITSEESLEDYEHPEGWLSEGVLQRMMSVLKIRNCGGECGELMSALEQEPSNTGNWLQLAKLVKSDIEKRVCLQKVLEIAPNHPEALAAWASLPPTPWPRDEAPRLESIPNRPGAQGGDNEAEMENISERAAWPAAQATEAARKASPLRRLVWILLALALIFSQAWQFYRIQQLENQIAANQATLFSLRPLLTELIVKVEQQKLPGR